MSEMLEKVARAICAGERMNEDDPLGGWMLWIDAARSVLADLEADGYQIVRVPPGHAIMFAALDQTSGGILSPDTETQETSE